MWFNDPHLERIAIALTQTVGFLFNGGLADFEKLAANVHFSDRDPNHHRA